MLGVSRPQGSAWDIGAYEYVNTQVKRMKNEGRNTNQNGWLVSTNPIKATLFGQCLRARTNLIIYNLAGNVLDKRSIENEGIYLIQDSIDKVIQKVTIIK
jgi:hypothetical protein